MKRLLGALALGAALLFGGSAPSQAGAALNMFNFGLLGDPRDDPFQLLFKWTRPGAYYSGFRPGNNLVNGFFFDKQENEYYSGIYATPGSGGGSNCGASPEIDTQPYAPFWSSPHSIRGFRSAMNWADDVYDNVIVQYKLHNGTNAPHGCPAQITDCHSTTTAC